MGKNKAKDNKGLTLIEVANNLKQSLDQNRVQLIYAFNGVGKTRLSREFEKQINSNQQTSSGGKVIYYNAFTEDLFYWDNEAAILCIRENHFTSWILETEKLNGATSVVSHFQRYVDEKLKPQFIEGGGVQFSYGESDANIKISKGEESCFIWSFFYCLLCKILEDRGNGGRKFRNLEYVFIDDPVSSLDENHLINIAIDLAALVKNEASCSLKFVITTHNPLFYNVLWNELKGKKKGCRQDGRRDNELCSRRRLAKIGDDAYQLPNQGDTPFSHHIVLLRKLDEACKCKKSEDLKLDKCHVSFLRQILEKTATFLGYHNWADLLPKDDQKGYYTRMLNLASHSKVDTEEPFHLSHRDKQRLRDLIDYIYKEYKFYKREDPPKNNTDSQ